MFVGWLDGWPDFRAHLNALLDSSKPSREHQYVGWSPGNQQNRHPQQPTPLQPLQDPQPEEERSESDRSERTVVHASGP